MLVQFPSSIRIADGLQRGLSLIYETDSFTISMTGWIAELRTWLALEISIRATFGKDSKHHSSSCRQANKMPPDFFLRIVQLGRHLQPLISSTNFIAALEGLQIMNMCEIALLSSDLRQLPSKSKCERKRSTPTRLRIQSMLDLE